jgi:hypothetical protein
MYQGRAANAGDFRRPRCNPSESLRFAKIFTTDGTDDTDDGNPEGGVHNLYPCHPYHCINKSRISDKILPQRQRNRGWTRMDADGIYLCESASIRGSLSSVAALPLCAIRGSTPLVAAGRAALFCGVGFHG